MSLPNPNAHYGVLFAPFQTCILLKSHKDLLESLTRNYSVTVVALPVSRISPSKTSPLDFESRRKMIHSQYPHAVVVPVPHTKYPEDKVKALEAAVRSPFSELRGSVIVHGPTAFQDVYKKNGGKWDYVSYFLTEEEMAHRFTCKKAPTWRAEDTDMEKAFRYGVIHALNTQFPISWSTIDMAITRIVGGTEEYVLLGKKPGELRWRFPGGFKDRPDPNYETSVLREGGEEVLQKGVDAGEVLTHPRYIGSRNVNDWRYDGEIDGITTLFFGMEFIGTDAQIKANDDLVDAKWFEISSLKPDDIEGEHIHLLRMLLEEKGMIVDF